MAYLVDTHPRFDQLNDDFGIEVKVMVLRSNGSLLESGHRVNPITGMKLTQIRAQQTVLKRREDFVADNL